MAIAEPNLLIRGTKGDVNIWVCRKCVDDGISPCYLMFDYDAEFPPPDTCPWYEYAEPEWVELFQSQINPIESGTKQEQLESGE